MRESREKKLLHWQDNLAAPALDANMMYTLNAWVCLIEARYNVSRSSVRAFINAHEIPGLITRKRCTNTFIFVTPAATKWFLHQIEKKLSKGFPLSMIAAPRLAIQGDQGCKS